MGKFDRLLMIIPPFYSAAISDMFKICDILRSKYSIDAHISFPDPYKPHQKESYHHNFNEWVTSNIEMINNASIHDLEREFDKSHLWKIIVSQRNINDYSYLNGSFAYIKKPLDDHIFILKALILYYVTLIRKYSIQVVYCDVPDNMHSAALFVLSKSLGFKAFASIVVDYLPNNYLLIDSEFWHSQLIKEKYKENFICYNNKVLPFLEELEKLHLKIISTKPQQHKYWDRLLKGRSQNPLRLSKVIVTMMRKDTNTIGDPIISGQSNYIIRRICAKLVQYGNYVTNKVFINFKNELPKTPYIYYPINYQPESVLLATHPVLSDQLGLIRALSVSLPAGYMLVVKDNPFMSPGVRPTSFYAAIENLPNVYMLHRGFDSIEVIEQAGLVITVSGHAGFEAACRLKRVLVLAPVHYDCLSNVWSIDSLRNLNSRIKNILFTELDTNEIKKSIYTYFKTLLEASYKEDEKNINNNEATAQRLKTLIEMNLTNKTSQRTGRSACNIMIKSGFNQN